LSAISLIGVPPCVTPDPLHRALWDRGDRGSIAAPILDQCKGMAFTPA
jgi:hypothetical protein